MNRIQILAAGSVAVGISVLALKYIAYVLTGSVALLSDAIESVVNLATAVVALLAIRWSATPPDPSTPMATTRPNTFPQSLREF
jgi:divalent metal cation (Fe/Co/Zn/Cd) transporter